MVIGVIILFCGREVVLELTAPPLPKEIDINELKFNLWDERLTCQFMPSVTGEEYDYQIVFDGEILPPMTFDMTYNNGLCSAEVSIVENDQYRVEVIVGNGRREKTYEVATYLQVSFHNNTVSWVPVD